MLIQLNPEQSAALEAIKCFLLDDKQDAFILRGSAGTGKTTLIAWLVDELDGMHLSCALLAPTGRAARILGNRIKQITGKSDCDGATIHRAIYTLTQIEVNEGAETANDPGIRMIFPLKEEEATVSLFVIDESSMVGDKENHGDFVQFGSGRLLKDVVTFARLRRPGRDKDHLTKLIFVGDPAQLPPVGESSSPALSEDYLRREFKLRVQSFDLSSVMRQAKGSAILDRATELRDALIATRFNSFSLKPNDDDVREVGVTDAVDLIVHGLRERESSVAIVHSNATALEYNRNIREKRWGDPDLPMQVNDVLLVNRNSTLHMISNGDLVKVVSVSADAEIVPVSLRGGHFVQLTFRDVTVAFRGADGSVVQISCFVLENLLNSPHRELSPLEQRALLVDFRKRHPTLHPKSAEFRRTIAGDPYFNALQVKYGYAMTCHKAQGGEWNTAIVDFSAAGGARSASFFRWAYTAITRAKQKLVVVNPPDFTPYDDIWDSRERTSGNGNVDIEDYSTDPDWNRLSFSALTRPLMTVHRQLRAAWEAQGIVIEQLKHLSFCERYVVAREGKRASVQYYYDKKYRPSRPGVAPGSSSDAQLVEAALAPLRALGNGESDEPPNQFIRDFLTRVDAAILPSAIRRDGYRTMPYRLRLTFSDSVRKGEIDFTYDGSFAWTSAQEVGGQGASSGLYEEIQRLMERHKELEV